MKLSGGYVCLMKMKELDQGFYKIRRRDYNMPFGAKHARSQNHPVHILRVSGYGERKRYHIDNDIQGIHPSAINEDYEVLSKYDGMPQVGNVTVTLAFADSSGERFQFVVRDAWSLRALFDAMPWLHKPFGYLRRKQKEHR